MRNCTALMKELATESCVCGYHVYNDVWEAAIGEEPRNTKDMLQLCSSSHDGKVSPLIVVGSQLFVNCGLP